MTETWAEYMERRTLEFTGGVIELEVEDAFAIATDWIEYHGCAE